MASAQQEIAAARVWLAQQRGQEVKPWDLLAAGMLQVVPYVPQPAGTCGLCGETTMDNDQAERVAPNGAHVHVHAECGVFEGWPLA